MPNVAIKNPDRRWFVCAAPAVAAAGLALTDASLFAVSAAAQAAPPADDVKLKVFRAQQIQEDIKALEANPGNDNLVQGKTFTMVLTTEKAKSAPEFEWHEHRDHIFQILDGSAVYELGGTPKGAHSKGPGEWLAPESEHHETVTLNKGDMLVIPRGTPHKRSTPVSVTFMLISPQGDA
jgi:mannose-6-phosphate isomerase-like protein (cupin superfamily)